MVNQLSDLDIRIEEQPSDVPVVVMDDSQQILGSYVRNLA